MQVSKFWQQWAATQSVRGEARAALSQTRALSSNSNRPTPGHRSRNEGEPGKGRKTRVFPILVNA